MYLYHIFSFLLCPPIIIFSMNLICALFPLLYFISWLEKFSDMAKQTDVDLIALSKKSIRKGFDKNNEIKLKLILTQNNNNDAYFFYLNPLSDTTPT